MRASPLPRAGPPFNARFGGFKTRRHRRFRSVPDALCDHLPVKNEMNSRTLSAVITASTVTRMMLRIAVFA